MTRCFGEELRDRGSRVLGVGNVRSLFKYLPATEVSSVRGAAFHLGYGIAGQTSLENWEK